MKKLLPILFATSLLLSACSIDWSDEKDKKIAKLEAQIEDDTFKKNQECQKLEMEMWGQKKSNELYKGDITNLDLSMIFYSPIRNSCLYETLFLTGDSILVEINDFFTKEIIYSQICDVEKDFSGYHQCTNLSKIEILKLKGE